MDIPELNMLIVLAYYTSKMFSSVMKKKTNKNWFGKRFHRQQHARSCDVNRFGNTG